VVSTALPLIMIRALHKHLGIPAETLIQEADPSSLPSSKTTDKIHYGRFPLKAMAAAGYRIAPIWTGEVKN